MELIEIIKQFARKQYLVVSHYPRDHLYIAGALCSLFLILLVLPAGSEDVESGNRTEIAIEIDLERDAPQEQELPDALVMSDFVITPETEPKPQPQPVLL